MTVLEAIQRSTEFLARKGVESARLHSELLLAHALKLPRMKLYLNFERPLSTAETDSFREMIRRRGSREPLQHIVGGTSFCGLEISVNGHVLVPRPETELLAEAGWEFLKGRVAGPSNRPATALDWGTGSGCIAIALAAQCPQAIITAVDRSPEALRVAEQNAAANQVAERIRFVQSDGFTALPGEERFDLIISNPPYIPTAEIDQLEPEVRDFDPRGALDGGSDGLQVFEQLLREAGERLAPGGRLMFEFGDGQAPALRAMAENQNWVVEAIREDYTRRPRILIATKTHG